MRILLLLLLIPCVARADLTIENAWIKNLPPVVPARAGYLTISNTNAAAVAVVGLHGEAFERIEMHRTVMKNGTMKMEPVAKLAIEADATLRFEPGGLHLMMYPRQPTRPGDSYRVTVEFDDGETLDFEMVVKP